MEREVNDKTWTHHNSLECKSVSRQWKQPSVPTPVRQNHGDFLNDIGVIHIDILPSVTPVTNSYYTFLLKEHMWESINKEGLGLL